MEKSRTHYRHVHSSLVSGDQGFLRGFLQWFMGIFVAMSSLLTLGSQPEVNIEYYNILLKDVINIELLSIEYSELMNQAMTIFYFSLAVLFGFFVSPALAIFMAALTMFESVVFGIKYKFWKTENTKEKSLPNILLLISIFSLMITVIIFIRIFDLIHSWWIISIFSLLAVIVALVFIRLNIGDRQIKSNLIITSKRGTHHISLKLEEAKEAQQFIWKSRTDVPKFSTFEPMID